jgi:hypothetical protein
MATPLRGNPPGSAHEGVVAGHEDFLRMIMVPGLSQVDDDVLQSILVPVPSDSLPSRCGGPLAQLDGPHGFHMGSQGLIAPVSGSGLAEDMAASGPHNAVGSHGTPVGWPYLDGFPGDAVTMDLFGSGLPSLPALAMGPSAAPPILGGTWDTPASPSVGSVKLGSPNHSQAGLVSERAGSGGSAGPGPPLGQNEADVIHKEKQRLAQKRFRERQRVRCRWLIEVFYLGMPLCLCLFLCLFCVWFNNRLTWGHEVVDTWTVVGRHGDSD